MASQNGEVVWPFDLEDVEQLLEVASRILPRTVIEELEEKVVKNDRLTAGSKAKILREAIRQYI
ncbi:MAG: hypothetical protein LRS48_05385, partial [Desulfurococcales archaeon]|nr:hypothetical protein [Desulfurococcales archaeon]